MSLWVRSQNKKELIECDNFSLNSPGEAYVNNTYVNNTRLINNYEIVCYHFEHSHCILGEYSTKEKALKVLDMIEKMINSGGIMFVLDECKTDFGVTATYEKKLPVFQMPDDEDIEE